MNFWNYDAEGRGWYIYGQGTVTPDGKQISFVSSRGSAEATTMANAFNDMTRSLRDQSERLKASYLRFSTVTPG